MVPPSIRRSVARGEGTGLKSVGHGTVLGGRYRLEEPLRVSTSGSLWRAVDETLDRDVQVRLLEPTSPHTPDVMDAARRVTLAKDARLAQILAVARDPEGSGNGRNARGVGAAARSDPALGDLAFIVIENLPGRALSRTVAGTPLPAAEARRLVGEAAEALAGAADRGLHHQRLTPESCIVGPDGSLKITGTAVEAAATGAEARDADVAGRVDAVGLVSVLYAALTGRWPGTTPSSLPPAPRVGGRPVPPADLVPGVPSDLNELCVSTLATGHNGPSSPAELAQRLAPWSAIHPLTDPRGLLLAPSRAGDGPSRPLPHAVPGPAAHPAAPAAAPASAAAPAPAPAPAFSATTGVPLPDGLLDGGAGLPHRFEGWQDLTAIGTPVPEREWLVPFAPTLSVDQPPRKQSRLVIAVLVVFVLAVVAVAALGLRNLGSPADLIPKDVASPLPVVTPTGPSSAGARTGPSSTAGTPTGPSPSAPPRLAGIQAIDPQADGQENNDQAPLAIDGDQSTAWHSSYYSTGNFGGLKSGLGLALKFAAGGTVVQQVTVDVAGSGGTVELRTATGPGLDGSTVVAQAPIESGHAVLTPARPVDSQLLLLWFTKLPQANGKYQLIVSEIHVR
jgi:hypothetical protein